MVRKSEDEYGLFMKEIKEMGSDRTLRKTLKTRVTIIVAGKRKYLEDLSKYNAFIKKIKPKVCKLAKEKFSNRVISCEYIGAQNMPFTGYTVPRGYIEVKIRKK